MFVCVRDVCLRLCPRCVVFVLLSMCVFVAVVVRFWCGLLFDCVSLVACFASVCFAVHLVCFDLLLLRLRIAFVFVCGFVLCSRVSLRFAVCGLVWFVVFVVCCVVLFCLLWCYVMFCCVCCA